MQGTRTMLLMFLHNWAWVLAMLLGLGLAGGFAIIPFRKQLPFALAVAPFLGLLLVTFGALAIYVSLKLPARTAGLMAWVACVVLTLVTWNVAQRRTRSHSLVFLCVVAALSAALAVLIATPASILSRDWGFTYKDGTDHMAYTHAADWLNSHLVTVLPFEDKRLPYHSYVAILFFTDPRAGSLMALALVSQFTGQSGTFSYDIACALILTAAALAVAAAFARARFMWVVVVAGLLTCHWFDFGRAGFFAKTLSFPAMFLIPGLYIAMARGHINTLTASVLVLLTASAAIMQSGESTALFLLVLAGTFLIATATYQQSLRHQGVSITSLPLLRDNAVILALMIGTSIVASGTIARPISRGVPDWGHPWHYVYLRISEIENQYYDSSGFTYAQAKKILELLLLLWAGLAAFAVKRREATATALTIGPMVLLLCLRLKDASAFAFQMIGVFYPLALCAAASLVRPDTIRVTAPRSSRTLWSSVIVGLTVVSILFHLPRFLAAVHRYGRGAQRNEQYTASQMNGLSKAIGTSTVDIDVGNNTWLALPLLIEIGRRTSRLQWSPGSWSAILSYRGWEVPSYPAAGDLQLLERSQPIQPGDKTIYLTNQFRLIRRAAAEEPAPKDQ